MFNQKITHPNLVIITNQINHLNPHYKKLYHVIKQNN